MKRCGACCATPRISTTRSSSATASAKSRVLHKSLQKHGFSVGALHGDMDQSARTAALDQFRKGEIPLLVASDVAARGLDIPAVSHVFNFDVPHHADDYVHRIGRTGRAGRAGTAISIVSPLDHKSIAAIEKLIGQTIPRAKVTPKAAPADPPRPRPTASQTAEAPEWTREGSHDEGKERSRGGRKPRREREPRRSGGGRHSGPKPQVPAAAFAPPAAPAASRTPSIGRAEAPQSAARCRVRARRSLASAGVPAASRSCPGLNFRYAIETGRNPFTGRSLSSLNLALIMNEIIAASSRQCCLLFWGRDP